MTHVYINKALIYSRCKIPWQVNDRHLRYQTYSQSNYCRVIISNVRIFNRFRHCRIFDSMSEAIGYAPLYLYSNWKLNTQKFNTEYSFKRFLVLHVRSKSRDQKIHVHWLSLAMKLNPAAQQCFNILEN